MNRLSVLSAQLTADGPASSTQLERHATAAGAGGVWGNVTMVRTFRILHGLPEAVRPNLCHRRVHSADNLMARRARTYRCMSRLVLAVELLEPPVGRERQTPAESAQDQPSLAKLDGKSRARPPR